MIKKLILNNFQSHKHTELDFSEGVNAIIGRSDVGKSAIMRALLWVIRNRPSGDAFRSHWGGDTVVEIMTETHIIRRIKGNTRNAYEIEEIGGTVAGYEAMGKGVPDEVIALLNVSDVNLSSQHDGPFLLADAPGDIAKTLNQAVNLTVIDKATSNIRKRLQNANTDLKSFQQDVETFAEELKDFDFIPKLEEDLQYAEELQLVARNARAEMAALRSLISSISESQEKIEQFSKLSDLMPLMEQIEELDEEVSELYTKGEKMGELSEHILNNIKRIKYEQDKLTELTAEFEKLMPNVCPLCEK
jgi:exonuclease SbcC